MQVGRQFASYVMHNGGLRGTDLSIYDTKLGLFVRSTTGFVGAWNHYGCSLKEVFLTPDPLGVFGPDGPNVYAYCRQNPWNQL